MKIKLVILSCLMVLLCGCSANVNIVVKEDSIEENVSITALQDNYYNKEQMGLAFRNFMPACADVEIVDTMPDQKEPGIEYYEKSSTELSNGYILYYKYNYGLGNYNKASSVKKAFSSPSIIKDTNEKTISLSTDNAGILLFKDHPNLTEVKINIKSEYPVKENNADSVKDNVYTWVFTPSSKKSIYILYDISKGESTEPSNPSNPSGSESGGITVTKKDKKNESEVSKIANQNPILIAIGALGLFFIFVLIITKITKK